VYYQIIVSDTKTGKVIRKTRKRRSRSFVKQFLQLLEASLRHEYGSAGHSVSTLDTGNTSRVIVTDSGKNTTEWWCADAVENDGTYGLVVGTSSSAESNTDYQLGTIIAEGSGAGQLDYSSHTWITTAVVGANVDFQVQRPFINNSGGSITIEEVGLYVKFSVPTGTFIFCVIRDITGSVVVADGQTATVDYTFRTTV